ncbi:MAG TPA: diguanylate cyclase [Acidimicrobiales bacterium]|jgi:diguanylate cyclase (GGDEF)-like protein|nr:diguanylate cyclase [Acidimicrobiales bacterium]
MGNGENYQQLANSMLGALLAVAHQEAGDVGVTQILARAGEHRSTTDLQRPGGWSTYEQGLALFRAAAEVLDDPDIGRKAGMDVLRQYAGTEVLALLRSLGSPGEMFRAYSAISAKQSTITYSEAVEVGDTHALIAVVTPNHERDRLFCGYTLGALSEFPVLFGMAAAKVEEIECQTLGDSRCLIRVDWDPTSSKDSGLQHEVDILTEQLLVLTKRYESLESVAKELASIHDVNSMLETITRQAGVAVRAPRYLLVAQLPGDSDPRIHYVGFTPDEANVAAKEVSIAAEDPNDQSRIVVDIESSRRHFGRLAVFYPDGFHFLPQERSLLMAYAGHAAAALETAAALAESRDRNSTLSALLALGMALAEQSSRAGVAQRLAEAIPKIAGCEQAHVLLWDEGDAHLARVASASLASRRLEIPEATALRSEHVAERLLEMSTPTFVAATSDPDLSSILSLTGLASGVIVPIAARDTLFGVLCAGCDDSGMELEETLEERLSGVASLAATALDSVTLLEEVRHQALHDPVTELANSRLFEDRVTQSLATTRRNGRRLAMLFVDLDRFKIVNDVHGHKVGDELLRAVAERLLLTVRDEDTVARIGGDEFGLIVQHAATRDAAEVVAQRIISAMDEPFDVHGLTLSIGVSIGVTMYPDAFDTYESVVSRADSAMYQAKAEGRGRFHTSCL